MIDQVYLMIDQAYLNSFVTPDNNSTRWGVHVDFGVNPNISLTELNATACLQQCPDTPTACASLTSLDISAAAAAASAMGLGTNSSLPDHPSESYVLPRMISVSVASAELGTTHVRDASEAVPQSAFVLMPCSALTASANSSKHF